MNCKQIDELMPLYAGRDLDEKRARLVSEHIENCATCALVAEEYRETVELTQLFAPPVFADNVYAGVRRQVMQQIEAEATAPLLSQVFGAWFRPRMAWALASALIIALGFFALYLVVNRGADVRPVANNNPTVNRPEQNPQSTAALPAPPTANPDAPRKAAVEKRRGLLNRPSFVAAKDPRSASRTGTSPKPRDSEAANSLPPEDGVPGKSPLRVEIQTKNPNIRIIWFSQTNSKPALPNSKGI